MTTLPSISDATNHQTLWLSFWDVQLSTFPVGNFRKRSLSRDEARGIIDSARCSKTLICVAREDLGAPYIERACERHEELCAALREHAGIEIQLRDFFGRDCANPLCLAEVGEHQCLLVVDCAYSFDREARSDVAPKAASRPAASFEERALRRGASALGMSIAPDSIKFYVFERIEGLGRG